MRELADVLTEMVKPCPDFNTWKSLWCSRLRSAGELRPEGTLQQAFYDGCRSDRIAWAFSGGYQWAIRSLIPIFLNTESVFALCITEEGGGHPRSIQTLLTGKGAGFVMSGRKQFVSGGTGADILLVAAKTGQETDGRPQLKMMSLPSDAGGVSLQEMPTLPFVQEVPHAVVIFDDVSVPESAVLPGDGYKNYIRLFRLQEDMHVQAAVLGLMVRKSHQKKSPELVEQALGLFSLLEGCHRRGETPVTGLAMAGMEACLKSLVDQVIDLLPESEHKAWQRDRALLDIAGKVRAIRLQKSREWLDL